MSETIPYITIFLLCTIGVISISGFNNYSVIEYMRHYPYQEHRDKSYYRWLSCGFVHGSYIHLILNAFVLWQFGFVIEKMYIAKFGSVPGMSLYLSAYLLILVLSCVPTYIKHKNNSSYASIGASGAISGILFIIIFIIFQTPSLVCTGSFLYPHLPWVFCIWFIPGGLPNNPEMGSITMHIIMAL
jgi:membrane associated rhomboid family serine protease